MLGRAFLQFMELVGVFCQRGKTETCRDDMLRTLNFLLYNAR
jgi:hypothetical protein